MNQEEFDKLETATRERAKGFFLYIIVKIAIECCLAFAIIIPFVIIMVWAGVIK